MNKEYLLFILVGHIIFMVIMWFFVTTILRRKTGMSKDLAGGIGDIVNESEWGSADINGVHIIGRVKIVVYDNGYMLVMKKILGGDKLWLPKDNLKIVGYRKHKLFITAEYKEIASHRNHIKVYGKLAEVIR